jgi:hypothetical protein
VILVSATGPVDNMQQQVATLEEELRLHIQAAEAQQEDHHQQQREQLRRRRSARRCINTARAPAGQNSTNSAADEAAAAAAVAAADAAAAELLAEEEAAAAAAAAKAAKKAAKKQQRKAAACAGSAPGADPATVPTQPTEAAVDAGSNRQTQEAAAVCAGTSQQQGTDLTVRQDTMTGIGSGQAHIHQAGDAGSPPYEGSEAMQGRLPVLDQLEVLQVIDPRQAGAGSSSSSSPTNQQLGEQQEQTEVCRMPPAAAGVPPVATLQAAPTAAGSWPPTLAAAPVDGQAGPSSSISAFNAELSWSGQGSVPRLVVPAAVHGGTSAAGGTSGGAGLPSTPAPATPAPLPGVAGLFLQLSERRSPGGAPAASPLVPATNVLPAAERVPLASSSSSSAGDGWQGQVQPMQGVGIPQGANTAAPQTVIQQAGTRTTDSTSSNSPAACQVHADNVQSGGAGSWTVPGGAAATLQGAERGPAPAVLPVLLDPATAPNKGALISRAIKVGKDCVVCMEARSCVLQLPCRHFCCCEACMQLLWGRSQECPMCRTQVTEYIVL